MTKTPALSDVRLTQTEVIGADGTRLYLNRWHPTGELRAVILALHGYGDTGRGTFQWAAEAWAAQGIATYAYDQRGFGRNADRRQWPGADRLIVDARAVTAAVRRATPDVPVILLGHSMGGGVALAAAADPTLAADALVLAAPAIAGGAYVNPLHRLGGWAIAVFLPDRRFTGERLPETVELFPTDDIDRLRSVVRGGYHFADPAGRDLQGLIRLMDRAAVAAPDVTLPVLTVMGAEDDYLKPRAVRKTHESIAGAAEFRLYRDGWHWILRDQQSPAVWADIAAFTLAQSVR